jgi:hypothetical protein
MEDWAHPASRGSYRGRSGPSTGAIHQVMQAEADARPEEHSDNGTKAVGSQLLIHRR